MSRQGRRRGPYGQRRPLPAALALPRPERGQQGAVVLAPAIPRKGFDLMAALRTAYLRRAELPAAVLDAVDELAAEEEARRE